jgi:hypothetical protein
MRHTKRDRSKSVDTSRSILIRYRHPDELTRMMFQITVEGICSIDPLPSICIFGHGFSEEQNRHSDMVVLETSDCFGLSVTLIWIMRVSYRGLMMSYYAIPEVAKVRDTCSFSGPAGKLVGRKEGVVLSIVQARGITLSTLADQAQLPLFQGIGSQPCRG